MEEERHAAESGREQEGETEGAVGGEQLAIGGKGRKIGYALFALRYSAQLEINQSGYQRTTEMLEVQKLQQQEKRMSTAVAGKLKSISGSCISSAGFRDIFVPGG